MTEMWHGGHFGDNPVCMVIYNVLYVHIDTQGKRAHPPCFMTIFPSIQTKGVDGYYMHTIQTDQMWNFNVLFLSIV